MIFCHMMHAATYNIRWMTFVMVHAEMNILMRHSTKPKNSKIELNIGILELAQASLERQLFQSSLFFYFNEVFGKLDCACAFLEEVYVYFCLLSMCMYSRSKQMFPISFHFSPFAVHYRSVSVPFPFSCSLCWFNSG
jgi:hypothetical protein